MVVRQRRHPRLRRLLYHIINPARPIQSGILSVEVQMDELLRQISGHEPALGTPGHAGKGTTDTFN